MMMKIKLIIIASIAASSFANATLTLNTAFGSAYDSSGVAVEDGTLWALVVDSGDSTFPGGFGLDASLSKLGASTSFTSGQQFALGGSFGSDKIFAVGGFNGNMSQTLPGTTFDSLSLDPLLDTSLVAGRNAAFYFFPGVRYIAQDSTYIMGSQVGGINGPGNIDSGTEAGLVIPADGGLANFGIGTSAIGGNVSDARFTAVDLVPEPSSMFLASLGVFGLFRRRRN